METDQKKMTENQDVINAFHMTWSNYPESVLLVTKNRDIIAVNKKGAQLGVVPGLKCHTLGGNQKVCGHCKANKALKNGSAIREVGYSKAMAAVVDGYWIPIEGNDNLYVHFGNNITAYAKKALFPSENSKG